MNFYQKLNHAWEQTGSLLCVGLDPDVTRIPPCLQGAAAPIFEFNRAIIDATAELASCYKPQFAHYAAAGLLNELRDTIDYIRERAPHSVVILDFKRGDIGSTARHYAEEGFEVYGADAVTVNPYMGGDTLKPFTEYKDKGVIVLCKTSNPGSAELQGLKIEGGRELYLHVAEKATREWNRNQNLALVVGATYPAELGAVRQIVGDMPLLVPGIGAQGGDLEGTLKVGLTASGTGLMINSSRGILYAGTGDDFAEAAAKAAGELHAAIRAGRN